ncbi:type II secretion system GspH family protein [Natroniella sulfidigena]|uniref:type II secretion system protein n=1 Tax=Natroniella sulfidigena TaxID=723921 RepID=UPI00200A3820|nr:type II secretion system protein [Natroniella sulfidigena]MCK8817485.1 type II secretion system GspH family protein [Natroniella sulfidigena]
MSETEGFTVLELLIVIVVIGVLLIPVANTVASTTEKLATTSLITEAVGLAQLKLEEERKQEFEELKTTSYQPVDETGEYQYTVEVEQIEEGLKQVLIRVYWQDELKVELETFNSRLVEG